MKKMTATLAFCGVLLTSTSAAYADASGWQPKGTDKYIVDDYTVTQYKSFDGGGIKACFRDVHHAYSVQLMENDDVNPDDEIGGSKTLKDAPNDEQCLVWSDVDTEPGEEELYVKISKNSTTNDTIYIDWYD